LRRSELEKKNEYKFHPSSESEITNRGGTRPYHLPYHFADEDADGMTIALLQ